MKDYDGVNIRHIKFTSGDEVISYVAGNNNDQIIVLERPLQIHRAAKGGFFFSQWHPFADKDECVVNPNNVVSHSECLDVVKERYIQICLRMDEEPEPFEDYEVEELADDHELTDSDGNIIKFPGPKTFH